MLPFCLVDATMVLMAAGMPDGAIRPLPVPTAGRDAIRRAVMEILAQGLEPRLREPVYAWLAAFRHHFPGAFARELGSTGDALLAKLAAETLDRNRCLKLRRIAVENLARLF
ncbi:MAG: hypothetical protein JW751_24355 [Polyangiaceae bacterium]|nr:hypothetical protein [Polyangiaceae bacterium]